MEQATTRRRILTGACNSLLNSPVYVAVSARTVCELSQLQKTYREAIKLVRIFIFHFHGQSSRWAVVALCE